MIINEAQMLEIVELILIVFQRLLSKAIEFVPHFMFCIHNLSLFN